jgi:hypothetical protein
LDVNAKRMILTQRSQSTYNWSLNASENWA